MRVARSRTSEPVNERREFHTELPSTQSRAIELARAGAAVGTTVVAARQARGVGRLDHRWESPVGGLYLSALVRPGPAESALVPLASGGAIAEAIGQRWDVPIRVKWPNDLLIPGPPTASRKLGGVIADRIVGPAGPVAVVGVGINVRRPLAGWPPLRPLVAVALDEVLDVGPTVEEVESVVVPALERVGTELTSNHGRQAALDRTRRLLHGLGKYALLDGRPVGQIRGLADDGALELELDGEPMTIRAGDLTVVEP